MSDSELPWEVLAFLPLHPVEFGILLALTEGVRHGYDIIKDVEDRVHPVRELHSANLYRRIRRMRERGLIEDAEPAGQFDDDDRERKFFRISSLGRRVARAEAVRLRALVAEAVRTDVLEDPAGS